VPCPPIRTRGLVVTLSTSSVVPLPSWPIWNLNVVRSPPSRTDGPPSVGHPLWHLGVRGCRCPPSFSGAPAPVASSGTSGRRESDAHAHPVRLGGRFRARSPRIRRVDKMPVVLRPAGRRCRRLAPCRVEEGQPTWGVARVITICVC
jgi:hypothetical protein